MICNVPPNDRRSTHWTTTAAMAKGLLTRAVSPGALHSREKMSVSGCPGFIRLPIAGGSGSAPRALRQGTLTGGSAVACKSKYVTTVRPRLSDFTTRIDTFTRISFLGSTLTPTLSPPVESGIRTL